MSARKPSLSFILAKILGQIGLLTGLATLITQFTLTMSQSMAAGRGTIGSIVFSSASSRY